MSVDSLIERLVEGQKELHEEIQNLKKRRNRENSPDNDSRAPQQEKNRRPKIINGKNPHVNILLLLWMLCIDSRYGALDQRLNESRRTWKTPRK